MNKLGQYKITRIVAALTILMAIAGFAIPATAQTYTPLYAFGTVEGSPDLGPVGPLVLAQNGNVYGTTNWNQSNIYSVTSAGAESVLWQSAEGAGDQCEWQPGSYNPPFNGMTLGADGLLYGTCWMWNFNQSSYGVIYKYDPSLGQSGFTVVYSFPFVSGQQNTLPSALTLGTDGNLYGTTYGAGSAALGTVYRFNPTTNKVTTLHNFQGSTLNDGANPSGPLTLGSNGAFFGTTYGGGVNGSNLGTVYSITTKGKIKILYSFSTTVNSNSGTNPNTGVTEGVDGNFYGVTYAGGVDGQGTIFKVTPAGKLTDLHDFNEATDNAGYPVWPLALGSDGNFYSSAQNCAFGGCSDQSLFEIATKPTKGTYTYTNLYNFTNPSLCSGYIAAGCGPSSSLLQLPNGSFYGVTSNGGGVYPTIYATGVFYSLNNGLKPFVIMQFPLGAQGAPVGIFGQGFSAATAVAFNGKAATFNVVSDTYMTATIPTGATKGYLTVTESSGTLQSNIKFTPVK